MKKCPTTIWLLVSAISTVTAFGQTQPDAVYTAFDNVIQTRNAAYNNGKIHFNKFQSIDKTFRYYKSAEYLIGDLVFDGQRYDNHALKYDLLADELVVKFDGEGNKMGFSPVKQRIDAFYIDGAKFVNLDLVAHPDFISGFYEEAFAGNISLLVKHRKNQITALTNEKVLYTYVDDYGYFLKAKGTFYRIDGKRDVVDAIPTLESQITEFFDTNVTLEKTDRRLFMKKLAQRLSELLNTAAK